MTQEILGRGLGLWPLKLGPLTSLGIILLVLVLTDSLEVAGCIEAKTATN